MLGCFSAALHTPAVAADVPALTPEPVLTNARKWSEPVALFGSDPKVVHEIVTMEKAVEANFNNEFLHDPDAPLKYYTDHKDVSFIDILSPGEYYGADVRNWFNFIGPQFVGHLGLKSMHVYAKNTTGFVYMNQTYEGKLADGRTFLWVMRQTDVVEKIKGEWKILHTHLSFAANPKTADPFTWEVDREMPPRPLPWTVGKQ
jgi:ketosteroid isomerase-like protein